MDNEKLVASPNRKFAFTLIWTGIVGWFAAFSLTLERIHLAADPTASLSCDINVWISCAKVMLTPQAKLFGFPNPIIGLGAFVFPIAVGFAILAGAQFKMWFWRLFTLGVTLGFGFVVWLFIQTNYVIHALCPYCMLAWIAMIPMFWKQLLFSAREGIVPVPLKSVGFFVAAYDWHWLYSFATFGAMFTATVWRFWDLWPSLF